MKCGPWESSFLAIWQSEHIPQESSCSLREVGAYRRPDERDSAGAVGVQRSL